jgi:nicotinate-nucleotide pyrophosphorylase (carboxylating)
MSDLVATKKLIQLALAEDIGKGDLTAQAVPAEKRAKARLIAKEWCVVSGLELAQLVLDVFEADARVKLHARDGDSLESGSLLLELSGNARHLLTTERTILNLLQRVSGVATQARRYKDALGNSKLILLDTRKTTPGLRDWEKKAVRDAGLQNHRARLDDGILVKENHIRAAGSIRAALENLKGRAKDVPLEVEVTNFAEAEEAVVHGAMRLLLDNLTPDQLREIVPRVRALKPGLFLEASGGVKRENLRDYAAAGVDAVSIGALTHSVPAVDLSLLFEFH